MGNNKEVDPPNKADTHTNFVATGPATTGIGFFAGPATNGFKRGVVGIGSNDKLDQIKDTIGVLGYTGGVGGNSTDGNG
jgi:hypothetical protein